jgi:single-stranded DNA-specific DHH superfamily exonuclease
VFGKEMTNIPDAIKETAKRVETFLTPLSSKKAALFFDDDPDGIASGVILEKLLKEKGIEVILRLHNNKQKPPFSEAFIKDLERHNVELLVVTDFSIAGFGFYEDYKKFMQNTAIKILILEHHQDTSVYSFDESKALYINSGNIQNEINGSQYCCAKFSYDIATTITPQLKKYGWIAAIGIIGDSNYYTWGEFVKKIIQEKNKTAEKEIPLPAEADEYYSTPYGKAAKNMFFGIGKEEKEILDIYNATYTAKNIEQLLEFLQKYDSIKYEAYDYIENYEYLVKTNPPNAQEMNVAEIEIKSKYYIGNIVANIISAKYPDTIFFVYNKNNEGYVYISTRLQTGKINLGKVFNKCEAKVSGAKGGGHNNAAGARVPEGQFKAFRNAFYGELEHV